MRLLLVVMVAWHFDRVRETVGHLLLTVGFSVLDTVAEDPLSDTQVDRIHAGIMRKVGGENGHRA